MRTGYSRLLVVALVMAGCGDQARADQPLTSEATTVAPTPATTRTPTTEVSPTTVAPVSQDLIDDCVRFVPFKAFIGDVYMQVIWKQAHEKVTELREVCNDIGQSDPAGLQRISDEQQALDAYFKAVSQTSVTSVCAPGSVMQPSGFCGMDRGTADER